MWKYDARFQRELRERDPGGSKSREGDSARVFFFFMGNTDWKFFENYAPDNNIFSGKQYRALRKKYARETDESRDVLFSFFTGEGRANAQLKRFAKRTDLSRGIPFYAGDVATDAFDVFRNAVPFLNQTRERKEGERGGRGETQKETRPKLRQIRAYLSTEQNCDCSFVGTMEM